ncbi:MAG: hypothetical protein ACI85K_000629 [Hyphomicrobiaceae bacterium]
MRVEVIDPSGHGIGTAIGLLELGHAVRYVGAHSLRPGSAQLQHMRHELIEHMFGGSQKAAGESDLLVIVDVFGDYLQCFDSGIGPAGVAVTDPMQDNAGVLIYPHRLQFLCDRAQAASRVAVIDMSDHGCYREPAFEALPNAHLFAREVHATDDGAWRPFPFLYNLAMLWAEYTRPQSQWLVTERSTKTWDWVFCGTLAHERYGRKREAAIQVLAERWPELTGAVLAQIPFHEVLCALQSVRLGLDLPGVGELCFRLHECLAVGTPVWRPFTRHVALPAGLQDIVIADPSEASVSDPEAVRAIYAERYAPMAAARWLLAGIDAPPDQYSITHATYMAAAASK